MSAQVEARRTGWDVARTTGLAALAVLLAVVVIGPGLGRGVILLYDMAWSPDPRFTPFTLGLGTPAPRAVPSDAVAVVLGAVVGAGLAQSLVLVAIVAGCGFGSARLLSALRPTASTLALSGTIVAAIWNPLIYERLVLGQWGILIGVAVLPWVLAAAVERSTPRMIAGAVVATLGGGNAVLVAVAPTLIFVVVHRWWRQSGWVALVTAGGSAVWALPALWHRVGSDPIGATLFAPRADTPLGLLGSLLSGGGIWNTAAHPPSRQMVVTSALAAALALASAISLLRIPTRSARTVVAIGVIGLGAALASGLPISAGLWEWLTVSVSGGGLLRDSHKLIAWWVVAVAVGAGALIDQLRTAARLAPSGVVVAGLLAVLPVALLPALGWGAWGRVAATSVPDGLRTAAQVISDAPPGTVGLLPWSQYRRYAWNEDRVSLTLGPRMIDQRLVFDDSLATSGGRVAGEDAHAEAVARRIRSGVDPVDALVEVGVDYIAVERQTGLPEPDVSDVGPVVVATDQMEVRRVAAPGTGRVRADNPAPVVVGWVVTLTTWSAAATCLGWRFHANRQRRVLVSPP